MSVRRLSVLAAVMILCVAGTTFAQKKMTVGDIGVAKNLELFEDAGHTTIQAAVNAARPGQTIEILDTEVYTEQITIDGREKSPWAGVTGGKHGIKIRYVPPAGTAPNSNFARPTIRYRDIANTSPKSNAEARKDGELTGQVANFETCGAVRILRASGVVLDGLAIDAVSAFPFGANNVWCDENGANCSPLFHGNAAITLAVSGGAVIRNCDIKNGYFGINVKDRNTGGVFGNKNKSDIDTTIPLSGFGQTGGHLFEYNRIHDNSVAVFFESAWDLGSSVRYNLIYNNEHKPATKTAVKALNGGNGIEFSNQMAGGFLFKDMYLTPIAIYNNTLYGNAGNLLGNWQIGGQHLIFNNIFSRSSPNTAFEGDNNPGSNYMVIDGRFPHRMHHSVFTGNKQMQMQTRGDLTCPANEDILPGGRFIAEAVIWNFTSLRGTATSVSNCQQNPGPTNLDILKPGALITSTAETNLGTGANAAISSSANLRWLQTDGYTSGTSTFPMLFKSVTETSADFLVPDWNNADVIKYIKNQGWGDVGVRNTDGTIADLGAIPSTGGQQKNVARVVPSNVVLVTSGTQDAKASVQLTLEEGGKFTNPTIKFLRWVSPLPENNDPGKTDWANNFGIVAAGSIRPVTPIPTSALKVGNNEFNFRLPAALTAANNYGFFEIVVQGKDGNGNDIVSDVGFLPYRQLDYELDIKFYVGNSTTATTNLTAGETYRMHVTPIVRSTGRPFANTLNDLSIELKSSAEAFLYNTDGTKMTGATNIATEGRDFNVYFERAGEETVMGSGLYSSGNQNLVFLGVAGVTVSPGAPAKVKFQKPGSKSDLGEGRAPVINRGVDYNVEVEVQDKFGNAVGRNIDVSMAVTASDKLIGDVRSTTAKTDSTGIARFAAYVTNGAVGDEFDMTASISGGANDVGRLRIGRTLDQLMVFYSETTVEEWKNDITVEINGPVTEWYKVTVRAVTPDAVITSKQGTIRVTTENSDIIFAATPGGAPATDFPMASGVASFWVSGNTSSKVDITGCIDNVVLLTASGDLDNSIAGANRCGITLTIPFTNIKNAVVYGDGYGRPDSVLIHYDDAEGSATFENNGLAKPDSVELWWPRGGTRLVAKGAAISAERAVARVRFSDKSGVSPGFTAVDGNGRGLVGVYAAGDFDNVFDVLDGVGPIISDGPNDGRVAEGFSTLYPMIIENVDPGNVPDTLIIEMSEPIEDEGAFKGGLSLVYSPSATRPTDPAIGGAALEVAAAMVAPGLKNGVRIILEPGSESPKDGNWIRINESNKTIKDDAAGNGVHPNNRWVQIKMRAVPPSVESAYYTSDAMTGRQNYIYFTFNKDVDPGWFTGGYFKFGTARGDSTMVEARFLEADGKTLRVNLGLAWPNSQDTVTTSGTLNVTMGFGSGMGWPPLPVQVIDRAAPVLATDVILKIGALGGPGEDDLPDTLEVIYSEILSEAALAITEPVIIKMGTGTVTPTLGSPRVSSVTGTSYSRVTYVVAPGTLGSGESFPRQGDSVYIRGAAGVSDGLTPPNTQEEPDNRKVPLKIKRGPLNWLVVVKNNPFRGSGGNSVGSTVTLTPGAKGATVRLKYSVRLYDNLGNIVVYDKDRDGLDIAEWSWNGYNNKGRVAGTGTYLFKATCDAEVLSADKQSVEQKERYVVTRSIGFVR